MRVISKDVPSPCSPKLSAEKLSSNDEINSIARFVSKAEDLEMDRVFSKISKNGVEETTSLNRSLFEFGHNFEDADGWLKLEQPCKDRLATVLRYMFESHLKTTVQIEINNMYFNCHFIVLQVYSRFFSELEMIPLLVTLPEKIVSQKAFMLSYKWMLSDEPVLELAHIVEVYVAATYLRISGLAAHCWKYFDDEEYYNEDTACVLYVESKDNPAMDVVRNLMLTRIRKFLLTFVATRDFLDLPTSHLIFLLESDQICVNTEIEVVFNIIFIVIIAFYMFFLGFLYSCSMAGLRLEQEESARTAFNVLYSIQPDAIVVSTICATGGGSPVGDEADFQPGGGVQDRRIHIENNVAHVRGCLGGQ